MTRIRAAAGRLRAAIGRWPRAIRRAIAAAIAPFRPEPGTTEGAVMLGLALLAAGFVLADAVPLALLVPGAVLVFIGAWPALRRTR